MSDSGGAGWQTFLAALSSVGIGSIAAAWIMARSKRSEKAAEARQAERHDVLLLRQHVDGIEDGRTKMAFEMLTAICTRQDITISRLEAENQRLGADNQHLKEDHADCAQRLEALETDRDRRRTRLAAAEARVAQLEKALTDAGIPIPPVAQDRGS